MNIVVIDAQGGGIGKQIVSGIKKKYPALPITAVGTNSIATSVMLKTGADQAATGENAIVVACDRADIIVCPIGVIVANALLGEITPKIALAVGGCRAKRILVPINHCDNYIVGVGNQSMGQLIEGVVSEIGRCTQYEIKYGCTQGEKNSAC